MEKLIRVIEQKDLSKIKEVLNKVFGDENYIDISRLGGMTNHSYKITKSNGEEYLVRIPGEGTEEMINRKDERKSTELGCRLGIDSKLLYFGDDGTKVMQFISGAKEMDEEIMRKKENVVKAAKIFQKLHNCGEDTGVNFEVFEMAADYEKIIMEHNVKLYDDYAYVKQKVMDIKKTIDRNTKIKKVPCHNDSLIGNWVLDENDKLYLIDWEYSGMNEAMWDLSCLSIECEYTVKNDNDLLFAYYGRNTSSMEKKIFIAAKLYVDYLWTLWGLTRVPYDGKFMQEYADNRYTRLKNNIAAFEKMEERLGEE